MKLTPISAPRQIHGEGFPEGKVASPVGSIYVDRQAMAGAVRWIKTSGTGTTGWEVEYGDTGRRNVPGLTTAFDFSTSNLHGIHIRRVGDTITLTVRGIWISGQWITELLPSGFRPVAGEYAKVRGVADVDGTVRVFGNDGSHARLNFSNPWPRGGDEVSLEASWHTSGPWPTTLPGTQA